MYKTNRDVKYSQLEKLTLIIDPNSGIMLPLDAFPTIKTKDGEIAYIIPNHVKIGYSAIRELAKSKISVGYVRKKD